MKILVIKSSVLRKSTSIFTTLTFPELSCLNSECVNIESKVQYTIRSSTDAECRFLVDVDIHTVPNLLSFFETS